MKTIIYTSCLTLLLGFGLISCIHRTLQDDGGIRLTMQFKNTAVTSEDAEKTIDILFKRVRDFDIRDAVFSYKRDSNKLVIELPLANDIERLKKLVMDEGKVEFWETYENSEIIKLLLEANTKLAYIVKVANNQPVITEKKSRTEYRSNIYKLTESKNDSLQDINIKRKYPLLSVLKLNQQQDGTPLPGAIVGYSLFKDTAVVNNYLNMNEIRTKLPRNLKFLWSFKPLKFDTSGNNYELYAIKITGSNGLAPLTGDVISYARQDYDRNRAGGMVFMSMNPEGSKIWARLTRENIGRCIAMVIDNYVYSAPRVMSEIPSGNSQITGDFTASEARDLANIIRNKPLPVKVELIKEETIIGKYSTANGFINKTINAIRRFIGSIYN